MFKSLYNRTTIEALSSYAEDRLNRFAKEMPNGKLWNLHNGGFPDKVDAIGIQVDGTVVALSKYWVCSVNALIIDATDRKPWGGMRVALTSNAVGGTFVPDCNHTSHIDWEVSVNKYNKGLYNKNKIIVAVYEFEKEI